MRNAVVVLLIAVALTPSEEIRKCYEENAPASAMADFSQNFVIDCIIKQLDKLELERGTPKMIKGSDAKD